MKTLPLVLLLSVAYASSYPQEGPKQPKLLKKPRIYNAIVKSDEELIPSQSYPAVAPVIRPFYTGLFPYAPVIIPHVQPYPPEEYGSLKAASDYGEERIPPHVHYPSKELTPPAPHQPNPTYRAPSSAEAQSQEAASQNLGTSGSGSAKTSVNSDFDPNSNEGSPQRLNYEGELSPTASDDSYFPQDLGSKPQQSNDFGSLLQPPSKPKSAESVPQERSPFQSFFNYQPENSEIPNVPPPPLPVKQNENNSTKKKVDYPNAPPTLFSL